MRWAARSRASARLRRSKTDPCRPRGLKSQARAIGSQRTRIETCHASIDSAPLPIRQHDPGDKYAAASDGFFSTASRKRAVPVGCQRLHQSEDDGLPNAIRQTIKNSLRIGQTISASNKANATKCSTATYFPISTFSNKVRAQNKSVHERWGKPR